MNQFVYLKHGLFLELKSLGLAYSLVQKYASGDQVKVFEASPTPRGSILILTSSSLELLQAIATDVAQQGEYQAFTENSWLGANLSEKLIEAYLNQILAPLKENLVLLESESVCEAVKAAAMALDKNLEICEFRTLRSTVYKCVVSLTTSLSKTEVEGLFSAMTATRKISLTYISNPHRELRNQYNLE